MYACKAHILIEFYWYAVTTSYGGRIKTTLLAWLMMQGIKIVEVEIQVNFKSTTCGVIVTCGVIIVAASVTLVMHCMQKSSKGV